MTTLLSNDEHNVQMTYDEFLHEIKQFPHNRFQKVENFRRLQHCKSEIHEVVGITFEHSITGELAHKTDKDLITALCILNRETQNGKDSRVESHWFRFIGEKFFGTGGTLWGMMDYHCNRCTAWV